MYRLKIFLLAGLIISLIGCTKEIITEPENIPVIEKLYEYQVEYDSVTFKQRRDDFIRQLPKNTLAIIATNDIYLRNGDVDYEFRCASNFFYLTGFEEPNAVAVLRKNTDRESVLIMFVENRYGSSLQWLGPVTGADGALDYFHADSAYEFSEFGSQIASYLQAGAYSNIYSNLHINQTITDIFEEYVTNPPAMFNADEIINAMRSIKSEIELSSIQKAVNVSVQAFTQAMKEIEPEMYEYEAESVFDWITALNGCPRTAFPTIVSSGPNINILHYFANDRQMLDGDLVLIDFGAEYGYYAADITRTMPVNGKYTAEQATIYNIVLEAHLAVIDAAAPGISFYYLYSVARDIVLNGLIGEGIISGTRSEIIASGQYRQYIPAGLGHCVGLDVHDPFPREDDGDKILKENMVLAIEPHIYLYEDDSTVDRKYRNVSVRIEDVIRITDTGCIVLSKNLPQTVEGIEKAMN